MGSTPQAITKIYENNSATATTVSKTVESEIILNNDVPYGQKPTYQEIARHDITNPGVVGGVSHQN